MKNYRISVKDLIEFVLRTGDIDTGGGVFFQSNERALIGTKLHRKIQNQWMKKGFLTELCLPIKLTWEIWLTVEGRADGIEDNRAAVLFMNKTTDHDLSKIGKNYDILHWAQAYAMYIYSLQNNLKKLM